MMIQIQNQSSQDIPEEFLTQWLLGVEKNLRQRQIGENFHEKELIVVFLDESEAQDLNAQFRGKDYATDVLSFDPIEPDSIGELVLCSQVVERQAKEHELSFQQEAAYLVLHGLLHLLGFEHENGGDEAEIMLSLQDEIFETLLDQ